MQENPVGLDVIRVLRVRLRNRRRRLLIRRLNHRLSHLMMDPSLIRVQMSRMRIVEVTRNAGVTAMVEISAVEDPLHIQSPQSSLFRLRNMTDRQMYEHTTVS